MSLTGLLNTGASGLAVNQKGIEVTGNNLANVNTEGYTKQTIVVDSTPTLQFGDQVIGTGAVVSSISRETNNFVTKQLTSKTAEYGEESSKEIILAEVEQIFDIDDDNSLSTSIDEFFDAWQELSSNPSGTLERQNVMLVGENLASDFNSMVTSLTTITNSISEDLEGKIETLNTKLQEIADLNTQVLSAESTGISANSLRDQRELLLQEVSELAGISYYEESNGMISVQMKNGQSLVTASNYSTINTEWDSGTLNISITNGASTTQLDVDDFSGEIGGMLEMRDEYIPELENQLDTLAYTLVTEVNAIHDSGYNLDGVSRSNDPTLPSFFSSNGTATDPSGAASTLSMDLTSTSQIAAAGDANAYTGDNSNTLLMVALQDNNSLVDGNSSLNDYYGSIAAGVGLTVSENGNALASAEDMLTQIQNMRDTVSGVSTDEEMLLLVQYQSGYEAAARYLTTVDEMIDTLMNL
jgi:flagellar hook-associated protein 1 FlgK